MSLKRKLFLPLNIQFFAEGDPPEVDPVDDDIPQPEKPKDKPKKGDDRPAWVDELMTAIKGPEATPNSKTEVPAPQPPKVDEPEPPKQPSAVKKFLDWLA